MATTTLDSYGAANWLIFGRLEFMLIEVPMWLETWHGTERASETFFITRNLSPWMH
jgi:hypothetical protein